MDLLPDELVLKIFGYLKHSELSSCLTVCQKWHRVASDNSLWDNIQVSWQQLLNNRGILSTIAHQHPNVRTLVIARNSNNGNPKVSPQSVQIRRTLCIWNHFKHLSRLSTYENPVSFFCTLPSLISAHYKTLTCFICERSEGLGGEQFRLLFSNPSVRYKELSIAYCRHIGDSAIFQAQLNSYLAVCLQSLEVLNLDGVGNWVTLSDAGIIVFLSSVSPLLKSLTINGEAMTDESSKCIQNFSNLEHLSISCCSKLTDKSLKCFSNLKSLTSLHLKKSYVFTNKGFENLFESLSLSSSSSYHTGSFMKEGRLRKLSLCECWQLEDRGLVKVAKSFPHLIFLNLCDCYHLSHIGFEAVAQGCQKIETLMLDGSGSIAKCMPVLSASLPRLRQVYVNVVEFSNYESEMRQLEQTRPWIKVWTVTTFDNELICLSR